jgi:hypothetical protein
MPRAKAVGAASQPGDAALGASVFHSGSAGSTDGTESDGEGQSPVEVVAWFREQLAAGAPWHRALLEAMGRWTLAGETHNGRRYKYMVGREAFDWLLLAERICDEGREFIPADDLERLLFHGQLPELLEEDELRDLMGVGKYRAHLNFHYGIVLEEALQLAAEEYIRKIHLARGFTDSEDLVEDAFRHLYTHSRAHLLEEFRADAKLGKREGLTLHEFKEFTYWLHKRRISYWDPARVASDTRQAIYRLETLRESVVSFSQSR